MASAQSKLFYSLLRLIGKKGLLKRQFATGRFNIFSSPEPPTRIREICQVEQYQINGCNVFTLTSKHRGSDPLDSRDPPKGSDKHILYLHGGAYVTTFMKVHWELMALLIEHLHCTITAPDYPLAPAYTYKDTFAMMGLLYKSLLESVPIDKLILMGDSAGGGLALAMTQHMQLEGMPPPAQLILLSPWLDLTLANPLIKQLDAADPFVGIQGLRMAASAYAGDMDLKHYLLSPIYGPLEGLGRISVFVGTKEIMVADTRKLKALLEAKGESVHYYEYEDMVHVWMLLNFPESQKAKQQIIELISNN